MNTVLQTYGQFFSLANFEGVFTLSNLMIILTLVIMEGLLSADNALVLAMMVKHLPEEQQKKALTYGIWGAYVFRFLAIGLGTLLMKIWWVKLVASLYLLKLSADFFFKKEDHSDESVAKAVGKGFWGTVVAIELMDIAFSIDSIASAFGLSSQVWVLFVGAIFGILMMRGVAKVFVELIEKVPELEGGAYVLIAVIGVKMGLEIFNIHVPQALFFALLVIIFGGTFGLHHFNKKKVD